MASALVTGGAGFIGSHVVDHLVQAGYRVDVVDDLSSGTQRLGFLRRAGVEVTELDIRDPECGYLIERLQPELIVHLAAQIDVRRSVSDPVYDAEVNVVGTLRVLGAAARVGARVLTASSGGCIYGEANGPMDEGSPRRPDSPYGISKSVMDDYLRFYAEHGLEFANLALGNVYGPRQDPSGEAGVVAIFGLRLLRGEPCSIFGNGEQTRDFVYVRDVVEAFAAAAAAESAGETFNIGTGIETSVNQLYSALAGICGVEAEPEHRPARPGELNRSCLDGGKARRLLNWEPKWDLSAGLTETVQFLSSQTYVP